MKISRLLFLIIMTPAMILGGQPWPVRSMTILATVPVVIHVPGDAATLQEAVNLISDGGIIELAAGTYVAPSGGWIFNNLGKGFTIRAASGSTVILSGGGTTIVLRMQNSSLSAGKPITFKNLIFENGYSQTEGLAGGVTLYKSMATFIDCTFRNNTTNVSTTVGGGIYVADNSEVFFINTLWQDNIAQNGGAGLGVRSNSKIYIHNSRFIHNIANFPNHRPYSSGGGINLGNSTLRLSNTLFENNQAAGFGAGLYIIGNWVAPYTAPQSDVIVTNSLFLNNEAKPDPTVTQTLPTEGGGINMEDQSLLKVYNTRFIKNRAMIGGGLNIFRSTANVYNSVFLGNQANGQTYTASFGGSISVSSTDDGVIDGNNNRPTGKLTLEDSWVQGKYADVTTPGSQVGGCLSAGGDAVRIDGNPAVPDIGSIAENRAIVSINRVVFNDCDAQTVSGHSAVGGAIQVVLADLNLQNSLVMHSDALDSGMAGGMAGIYNSNINISGTTFAYNTAGQYGGGLFIQGSAVQVNDSKFYGNEVSPGTAESETSSFGAAVFTTIDDAYNLPVSGTIQNSVFSNNTGMAVFDDDRTNGPINDVRYSSNQFYENTFAKKVYRDTLSATQTVSGLNSLVISRSNGTSTDKSPSNNNTELSNAPKLGIILAGPTNILTTNAAGEAPPPPTLAYLGYAWNGASATLDGQAVTGNAGVSPSDIGTHTLSVGGTNFSAGISQAATPSATFTTSGNLPSTLSWSVIADSFLDVAVDHGVTVVSSASGSVQVSPPVDTDYWLYAITKEGGIVKSTNTGLPILDAPLTVDVLAGLNHSVNTGYFNIKNTGGSTLQWAATSQTPSLITINTASGQTAAQETIAFTLNIASLPPGDYVGTIYINAGIAGTAQVTVNVQVIDILYKTHIPIVIR